MQSPHFLAGLRLHLRLWARIQTLGYDSTPVEFAYHRLELRILIGLLQDGGIRLDIDRITLYSTHFLFRISNLFNVFSLSNNIYAMLS